METHEQELRRLMYLAEYAPSFEEYCAISDQIDELQKEFEHVE